MSKLGIIKAIIGVLVCFGIVCLVFIIKLNIQENNDRRREELNVRNLEMSGKLMYAYLMFFDGNIGVEFHHAATVLGSGNSFQDQEVTDIVFVHSEAEAVGFSDDVIVAWPSEYTVMFLEHLNNNTPAIVSAALDGFDITFPLTLEDLIDNWKVMNEVWRNSSSILGTVRSTFRTETSNNTISEQENIEDLTEEETTED